MTKIQTCTGTGRRILFGSAAFALILSTPPALGPIAGLGGPAFAQSQSQPGQGAAGGTSHGGDGAQGRGSDHTGAAATRSTHAPGGNSGQDMGQGGRAAEQGHYGQGGSSGEETGDEGTSLDKQGPRFGGGENSRKPVSGTQGGRPAWAKEGIPAVELGRLSVARAPAKVLDHAFTEVTANWETIGTTVMTLQAPGQPTLTMTVAQFYSLPATEFARVLQTYYPSILRIDSPLENLSLLKNLESSGSTALTGVTPASSQDLAAIFLGSASDKTIPVTNDTVIAVNTILGLPSLTSAQVADIAAKAEAVRQAILTGHEEG